MKQILNFPDFKLVSDSKFTLLAHHLGNLKDVPREVLDTLSPIGMGNFTTDGTWLVTLVNTRTSYVFCKGEQIAPSYVSERLHIYDKVDSLLVSRLVQNLSLLLQNQDVK